MINFFSFILRSLSGKEDTFSCVACWICIVGIATELGIYIYALTHYA